MYAKRSMIRLWRTKRFKISRRSWVSNTTKTIRMSQAFVMGGLWLWQIRFVWLILFPAESLLETGSRWFSYQRIAYQLSRPLLPFSFEITRLPGRICDSYRARMYHVYHSSTWLNLTDIVYSRSPKESNAVTSSRFQNMNNGWRRLPTQRSGNPNISRSISFCIVWFFSWHNYHRVWEQAVTLTPATTSAIWRSIWYLSRQRKMVTKNLLI